MTMPEWALDRLLEAQEGQAEQMRIQNLLKVYEATRSTGMNYDAALTAAVKLLGL